MTGYQILNLKRVIDEIGEEDTKQFLSDFSCPLNKDVDDFLKFKAIEFAKQGISQTHIVLASYKESAVIAGYYTLANKYIHIPTKNIPSASWRKRINKFGQYDPGIKAYVMATPLIGQLGKNYNHSYNKLITGDELLKLACDKIQSVQLDIGGKCMYLECEDKPVLCQFYEENGFVCFGKRQLDRDEVESTEGNYLLQYLKYIKS